MLVPVSDIAVLSTANSIKLKQLSTAKLVLPIVIKGLYVLVSFSGLIVLSTADSIKMKWISTAKLVFTHSHNVTVCADIS